MQFGKKLLSGSKDSVASYESAKSATTGSSKLPELKESAQKYKETQPGQNVSAVLESRRVEQPPLRERISISSETTAMVVNEKQPEKLAPVVVAPEIKAPSSPTSANASYTDSLASPTLDIEEFKKSFSNIKSPTDLDKPKPPPISNSSAKSINFNTISIGKSGVSIQIDKPKSIYAPALISPDENKTEMIIPGKTNLKGVTVTLRGADLQFNSMGNSSSNLDFTPVINPRPKKPGAGLRVNSMHERVSSDEVEPMTALIDEKRERFSFSLPPSTVDLRDKFDSGKVEAITEDSEVDVLQSPFATVNLTEPQSANTLVKSQSGGGRIDFDTGEHLKDFLIGIRVFVDANIPEQQKRFISRHIIAYDG